VPASGRDHDAGDHFRRVTGMTTGLVSTNGLRFFISLPLPRGRRFAVLTRAVVGFGELNGPGNNACPRVARRTRTANVLQLKRYNTFLPERLSVYARGPGRELPVRVTAVPPSRLFVARCDNNIYQEVFEEPCSSSRQKCFYRQLL